MQVEQSWGETATLGVGCKTWGCTSKPSLVGAAPLSEVTSRAGSPAALPAAHAIFQGLQLEVACFRAPVPLKNNTCEIQ